MAPLGGILASLPAGDPMAQCQGVHSVTDEVGVEPPLVHMVWDGLGEADLLFRPRGCTLPEVRSDTPLAWECIYRSMGRVRPATKCWCILLPTSSSIAVPRFFFRVVLRKMLP